MARQPPCGNYGDILAKGYINTTDVGIISAYVKGIRTLTPEQLIRADVDGDGVVTVRDARIITDYLNGDRDSFPVCETCPWDLNDDGVVDDADRDILMAAYESRPGDANWNPAADFNNDGVVDLLDLAVMGDNYGPCPSSTTGHVVSVVIKQGAILKIDGVEIL